MVAALAFMAACSQAPEVPTRIPTAAAPTEPPPTEPLQIPPTRDLSQPLPTSEPSPTVLLPTRPPTPTRRPPAPAVNITSPVGGTELATGSQVIIGGLAQVGAGQALSLTLVSATGHRLAAATPALSEVNSWQASMTIPNAVSGPARLQAVLLDAAEVVLAIDVEPVTLVLDTSATVRYLALFRPLDGENAVAGFNLFFDGRSQLPVNNVVTISLWDEECQVQVARQSFTLRGSGYWQGFLVVPGDVEGVLCAVAHFGTPAEETWREAHVTVNVLPADDDAARAVLIGNPPPGSTLTAGQEVLLYGTAYNAPEGQVLVSILLENGRVLTESVATADAYGYWEIALFIPDDAAGPAQINVSIGSPTGDDYAQNQNLITIEPAAE